jgi:AraC-like DNA-binding protein
MLTSDQHVIGALQTDSSAAAREGNTPLLSERLRPFDKPLHFENCSSLFAREMQESGLMKLRIDAGRFGSNAERCQNIMRSCHFRGGELTLPILKHHADEPNLMHEVDAPSRKVVGLGIEMVTAGLELDFHSHRKAQLLLSLCGVLTCEAESGIWIVPPQCAIWIPGGMTHRLTLAGKIEGYGAFIEPIRARKLPSTCCTITVNPLLRELLIRCAQFPLNYKHGGVESRVTTLLLDEVSTAPVGNLHLPMPSDHRLRTIFQGLMTNPADRGTIESWGRRVGLSERTLARVIAAETGMSFGRWRQQLNIILALQWLAKGASVQQVAFDLGYENVGSFVTMFRKTLGTPPGRYMTARSA